jgi:hypothetical protein
MNPKVDPILATVKSADLSPIEHSLLIDFVESAVDPEYAAQYISKRLSNDEHLSTENALRHLKRDWRRLVSKGRYHKLSGQALFACNTHNVS